MPAGPIRILPEFMQEFSRKVSVLKILVVKIPLNLPLLKRCSLHGVNWGGTVMADPSVVPPVIRTLAEWTLSGKINPKPTAVYPLDKAGDAFAALFGRQSAGSVVIEIQEAAR